MKVGIIQSNFLPWRGYFDFIRGVDLFIVYDDVQYTKNDWRNRNRIKTERGLKWITVPVRRLRLSQLIDETPIDEAQPWARSILGRIEASYRRAPQFQPYFDELSDLLLQPAESISELNLRLIRWVCGILEIQTPIVTSREFEPQGTKTERLISILKLAGASSYLSGPAAKAYIETEAFAAAGIRLEYKSYDYPAYEQLYPPFEPSVSVIDLLFMQGPDAKRLLDSSDAESLDR